MKNSDKELPSESELAMGAETELGEELGEAFQALAKSTESLVSKVDLSASILSELPTSSPFWKTYLPPTLGLALVAAALVFMFRQTATVEGVAIGRKYSDSRVRWTWQETPLTLATGPTEALLLTTANGTASLGRNSQLKIQDSKTLSLERGEAEVWTFGEMNTLISTLEQNVPFTISPHSHVAIESYKEPQDMNLLKKHKVALTVSALAIAVSGGYVTYKIRGEKETIKAAKGAALTTQGTLSTFPLHQSQADEDADSTDTIARKSQASDLQDEALGQAGAFWDEESQVVQFRVRGEAFDVDTGKPVQQFKIRAESITSKDFSQRDAIEREISNEEDGLFTLSGLGLGQWRILAEKDGYAPVIQSLDLESLQTSPYLVIPFSEHGASLSGRVIDFEGRPVSGANVHLAKCIKPKAKEANASQSKEDKDEDCHHSITGLDGRFVLDKLPEEEAFSLVAEKEGLGMSTSRDLRLLPEDQSQANQHVTIRLRGMVKIAGRVVKGEDEIPVASATVFSFDHATESDADGRYSFIVPLDESPSASIRSYPGSGDDLKIDSYPDNRSARPLRWVNSDTHSAEIDIDFFLEQEESRLIGTITTKGGTPLVGAELMLVNTNGWSKKRQHQTFPTKATTTETGAYAVNHIPSHAGYMVRYRTDADGPFNDLGYVNIREEETVRADFRVGEASIRGRFVSKESGEPIALAQMTCSRVGATSPQSPEIYRLAHCYPDGRFEIVNLPKGTWTIQSKAEWMDAAAAIVPMPITLSSGEIRSDVDLRIDGNGARLWKFRVLSKGGEILPGPYIRYQVGNSNTTANLRVGDDGIAEQQIDNSIKEVFIEVPGYKSATLNLATQSPEKVIRVTLEREEPDKSATLP